MFKKILIVICFFATIFMGTSVFVSAAETVDVLPEYQLNAIDYSDVDPDYKLVLDSNEETYEQGSIEDKTYEDYNVNNGLTINDNVSTLASYQSIYEKDSYEKNNSKGNAANLGTLYSEYNLGMWTGGTIHDTGKNYSTDSDDRDVDYYEFTIEESYEYIIELTNIPTGCDYDIKLYHKKKTLLLFNNYVQVDASAKGSNSDEVLNEYNNDEDEEYYNYLPKGTYVIEVYSYRGCSSQRYSLHIGFRGLDDDYEENDTQSNPYTLNLPSSSSYSTEIKATIDKNNDEDWYKIVPPSYNSTLTVNLHSPASNYKYNLELYRGSSKITNGFSSNVIDDQYTNIQLIQGMTYYVRVYAKNEDVHSTDFKYTLTFSGTNSNVTYNYKNSSGNWNQYGMIWEYDMDASTNSEGYVAKKYFSYNESYLYMTQKIYLYNFNAIDLYYSIGAYKKLLEKLEDNPTFLEDLGIGAITMVGTSAVEYIVKGVFELDPRLFVIELAGTAFKIVSDITLTEYQKNLYSYMFNNLENVVNDINNYRIEIEIYSRPLSEDKYIYVNFVNNDDVYAPNFFVDTIYTNEIVYGNISYLSETQNTKYVNDYIFNDQNNFKNNFPF